MKEAFFFFLVRRGNVTYSEIELDEDLLAKIPCADDQLILIGRADIDFSCNDLLYTNSGIPIQPVRFYMYGFEIDRIGHGCSCAILCKNADVNFAFNEALYISTNIK